MDIASLNNIDNYSGRWAEWTESKFEKRDKGQD
jgi:hypothetical protein